MPRIALTGGAYAARSVVAAAQRQLNLYSETIPEAAGEPSRMTLYPTPGLTLLNTLPTGPVRGIRQATNGAVYVVAGAVVYLLNAAWIGQVLGYLTAGAMTPVSMMDNGLTLVIVDGSGGGWTVDLASNDFALIDDPTGSFRGGDRVDYLDTFLLFNVSGTPQFQSSLSLSVTFDALYFANKESYSDLLVTLIVCRRELWLLGERTTEIWTNTGAADFPFAEIPGPFIDYGCAAKYSVAQVNATVFWLSRDRQGHGIVLKSQGYNAARISNFAVETAIFSYGAIGDAVGFAYQLQGHTFYQLNFPAADKTWCYDVATELWHELAWLDGQGAEHRHRANCCYFANDKIVVGDWQNGNIYALDPTNFTDNGAVIKRVRSFPHMVANGKRLFHRQFQADIQTGTAAGTIDATAPMMYLDWSDDRGASYGNPVAQSLGAAGEYRTSAQWQRLGMTRDRIYRLTWTAPVDTVLQGAWIDATASSS